MGYALHVTGPLLGALSSNLDRKDEIHKPSVSASAQSALPKALTGPWSQNSIVRTAWKRSSFLPPQQSQVSTSNPMYMYLALRPTVSTATTAELPNSSAPAVQKHAGRWRDGPHSAATNHRSQPRRRHGRKAPLAACLPVHLTESQARPPGAALFPIA
ncbi:uncharacterized protein BKA78DRAFT_295244 [Phyllosticta capitalensis]|uniref:uncharacterized protein n=1 Tax=Phyllosticta capitalensis TaxID=121624 RepID=UPI00312DAA7C